MFALISCELETTLIYFKKAIVLLATSGVFVSVRASSLTPYCLLFISLTLSQNSFSGNFTVGSSSAALNKGKCVTLCSALIRVIPADPTNQSRCAQESTSFP
ncbi:uncharacterized protein BJ212DRAFT_1413787 [Suillus subaureus]|uniref:Uncharacterized protein n=1 Tax=Suillus subaureus TaxID=48587 RepID=A0A9P7ARB7_9AGAM|nr:uncharacterized protein BJ212DRAFT_1413787 [Suillus subaureus]KAG1794035.1 hypothetical protein BJ212DRAFT_1413787 [Suillus subaureus]